MLYCCVEGMAAKSRMIADTNITYAGSIGQSIVIKKYAYMTRTHYMVLFSPSECLSMFTTY